MSQPIIFYDLPGKAVKNSAWSPNTWKVRYSLNYKGLPYKTEWVEYPDVEAVSKKIGASPTSTKPDGSPLYTLPTIFDPNTNTVVSDSIAIARYLDKTYPGTPLLIPPETDALHDAFDYLFVALIGAKLSSLLISPTSLHLNPPSEEYFVRTREISYGKPLKELSPPGPIRDGHWEEVKNGLTKLAGFLSADGNDKLFFLGDRVTYSDLTIASYLVWVKSVLGPEGQEYQNVLLWNDGKWGKLVKALERYEVVV